VLGGERISARNVLRLYFLGRSHSATVFNPSTRVSKCGHSGNENASCSRFELRSALGFVPQ
jgi:hypothetical protein